MISYFDSPQQTTVTQFAVVNTSKFRKQYLKAIKYLKRISRLFKVVL